MRRGGFLEEMDGFIYVMKERYLRTFPCPSRVLCLREGVLRRGLMGRFGRIPEPEDIIGSVLVKEGEVQPETYQDMPTYRFVTREGPMKLSPFLLEKLREKIREKAGTEKV